MLSNNKTYVNSIAFKELAMSCSCPDCTPISENDCTNSVGFSTRILLPRPFVPPEEIGTNLSIIWDDSCLKCICEKCALDAIVIDPCKSSSETPIPNCKAEVKRLRYVGCIKFSICLKNVTGDDNSISCITSDLTTTCVDQVICYSCNCDETNCPIDTNLVSNAIITSIVPTEDQNSNFILNIKGLFNFIDPPCVN